MSIGMHKCGKEGQKAGLYGTVPTHLSLLCWTTTVEWHEQRGATRETHEGAESLSVTFGGGLVTRSLITVLRGKTSLRPKVTCSHLIDTRGQRTLAFLLEVAALKRCGSPEKESPPRPRKNVCNTP